jgi:hypothetical protein
MTAPFEVEYAVSPRGRSAEIDDVDDRAAPGALDHRRDRVARYEEHAVDIDPHDPPPILDRRVDDAAARPDPDIVVEQIEPAEAFQGVVDQRAALRLVADIGDERLGFATLLLDHRDGLLGRLAQEVDDEDPRAGPRQQDCRRASIADPVIGRAAAGDDRHLAAEAKIVRRGLRLAHAAPPVATHDTGRRNIAPRSPAANLRLEATNPI